MTGKTIYKLYHTHSLQPPHPLGHWKVDEATSTNYISSHLAEFDDLIGGGRRVNVSVLGSIRLSLSIRTKSAICSIVRDDSGMRKQVWFRNDLTVGADIVLVRTQMMLLQTDITPWLMIDAQNVQPIRSLILRDTRHVWQRLTGVLDVLGLIGGQATGYSLSELSKQGKARVILAYTQPQGCVPLYSRQMHPLHTYEKCDLLQTPWTSFRQIDMCSHHINLGKRPACLTRWNWLVRLGLLRSRPKCLILIVRVISRQVPKPATGSDSGCHSKAAGWCQSAGERVAFVLVDCGDE